ncbi:MAG: hypothetical protein WC906_03705 [Parcubacteria group bacterium]|jgi:hypothetical protein
MEDEKEREREKNSEEVRREEKGKILLLALAGGIPATREVNPPGHWEYCKNNAT